ncbi:VOC family protein [Actinomadura opuntiae]|uniref:VOC family protein n=1 Tax=Actinomadura sp. OS1-43 TaxID=604315 RepID=UPI00255A97F4|nr:VOC family protein [Actinomadura sp. OS1-43]MDL4814118.1 VOC family protein [Actinomadura sp. OS1-43]
MRADTGMSVRPATGYSAGMPCWADLASPDFAASKAFYRDVFGWDSYTLTLDRLGDYEIFTIEGPDGPRVAGMQPLPDDTEEPSWTSFFMVEDVDATARAVRAGGGQDLADPVEVGQLGRMSFLADPEGADFGVWQRYGSEPSAEGPIEPRTMCWAELASHDPGAARRFYGEVFGWSEVARDDSDPAHTDWRIGDSAVAGMVDSDEYGPAEPPHWVPYFEVDDCDAATGLAADLGAGIRIPPSDVLPGRHAVIADPTGAELGLLAPSSRARSRGRGGRGRGLL